MIYTGYVKVTPGKPQTGRVKLNFHRVLGRLNPLVRVSMGLLQRGVFLSVEKNEGFSLHSYYYTVEQL